MSNYDAQVDYDDSRLSYEGVALTTFGIDYAVARYTGTYLKSKGVRFVCRYLRNSPSGTINKALTKVEADDLRSAGIDIVSNDETTGTQLTGGFAGGVADAKGANAAHLTCGGDPNAPIYFSPWDHDPAGLTTAQWQLLWDFLDGAASVLGRSRIGLYGGYDMIKRAFDNHKITWGWQTYAWSEGVWDTRAHIQQYLNGQWGGQVDYDRAMQVGFGQWGGPVMLDDTDKAFLTALRDQGVRLTDHGDKAILGSGNNLKVVRSDIAAIKAMLALQADDETQIIAAINAAAVNPTLLAQAVIAALESQGISISVTVDHEQLKTDFLAVLQGLVFKAQ